VIEAIRDIGFVGFANLEMDAELERNLAFVRAIG
jgi:hypothetical protein